MEPYFNHPHKEITVINLKLIKNYGTPWGPNGVMIWE